MWLFSGKAINRIRMIRYVKTTDGLCPGISLDSSVNTSQWRIQDFPEEGEPTLQGAPTYDFAKFPQKLHEIERIWTRGGGASNILLCRTATAYATVNKE